MATHVVLFPAYKPSLASLWVLIIEYGKFFEAYRALHVSKQKRDLMNSRLKAPDLPLNAFTFAGAYIMGVLVLGWLALAAGYFGIMLVYPMVPIALVACVGGALWLGLTVVRHTIHGLTDLNQWLQC